MQRISALKRRARDIFDPVLGAGYWPENTYLAIPAWRLVYCPIPKVACTSFKTLCVTLSERKVELGRGLHARAHKAYSLSRLRRSQARSILRSEEWFRFVFVRNPWDRLVCAFYTKFVLAEEPTPFALAVMQEAAELNGDTSRGMDGSTAPEGRRITFRDFVEHTCRSPDDQLDEHWKPQHLFLGHCRFDFVGRFETMAEDFQRLARAKNLPVDALPLTIATPYDPEAVQATKEANCVADVSAGDLFSFGALPDYRAFYTPELQSQVGRRHRTDIERFGYELEGPSQSAAPSDAIMHS